MKTTPLIPLMLSVTQELRDALRKLAAQQNLNHPEHVTSAAQIAREILTEHILNTKGGSPDE